MKIYPQTFEKVFSKDGYHTFDFSQITTEDLSVDEYVGSFKKLLKDHSSYLFDSYVKITWMKNKFHYKGKQLMGYNPAWSGRLEYVFSRFLRRVIGNDVRFFARDFLYSKVRSYFHDFFPDFYLYDPYKDKDYYKFPFKNLTMEFLGVVYQMDDRIEMLKYADKQHMTYATFLDFVINQVYSMNEELGRDKYIFMVSKKCQNYVKDVDKKFFSIKKNKK